MLPSSDLDILVLSDASADKLKPFVEAVLYPLWDAGLSVGHQVRSPREQLAAMQADLATCTAGLTARTLAGDREWADRRARRRARAMRESAHAVSSPRSPRALVPARPTCSSPTSRRARAGGATTTNSHGRRPSSPGRFSATRPRWSGAACSPPTSTPPSLSPPSRSQRHAGGSRLPARTTGLPSIRSTLLPPGDADAVQLALAETALVLSRARRRLAGQTVEADAPLSADAVFALIEAGETALAPLEEAAQSGRLEHLAPGYRALMTLRRPGLGHELTVGRPLVARRNAPSAPLERAVAGPGRRVDRAPARALRSHARARCRQGERGRRASGTRGRACGGYRSAIRPRRAGGGRRCGPRAPPPRARRDRQSHRPRRRGRDPLGGARDRSHATCSPRSTCLTAADSLATGRATWSPWTAALVGGLVSRLDAALSDDVDGAGLATRGEAVRARDALGAPRGARTPSARSSNSRRCATSPAGNRPRSPAHARLVAELSRTGSGARGARGGLTRSCRRHARPHDRRSRPARAPRSYRRRDRTRRTRYPGCGRVRRARAPRARHLRRHVSHTCGR